MRLPPEVVDQIVSYLLRPSQDPRFPIQGYDASHIDWDALIRCKDESRRVWSPYSGRGFDTTLYSLEPDVKTLLNLRLVSREWHAPATILLRNHYWFALKFDSLSSLLKVTQCCKPDIRGKSNSLPSPVQKLDMPRIWNALTFKRHYRVTAEMTEGQERHVEQNNGEEEEVDEEWALRHHYTDKLRSDAKVMHYDKSAELALLQGLFANLNRIEAFAVSFPDAGSDTKYGSLAADCYDMQLLGDITTAIQHGLQLPSFNHLIDLRLRLPSTWYVGQLADVIDQGTRDQLKHFYLEIVDESGCCGSDWYALTEDGEDEVMNGEVDDDYYYPQSNVQWEYPNRKHQKGLWDLLSSCPNLQSLGIKCTHFLDLDQMNWQKSPTSRGLRVLFLERAWASASTLLHLLQPHPSTKRTAQLRRIMLNGVKLKADSESWSKVFDYLIKDCPRLDFSSLYNLSYFAAHKSYEHNNRPYENVADIWTEDERDQKIMFRLAAKMVAKAGGKNCYPQQGQEQVKSLGSYGFNIESDSDGDDEEQETDR
ncbi:hypothetical protein B0T10DRAFT_490376 [Thelonectria olida]|uniref:Uncharacterized protein n=1 Tax=Thelonectria olida TaxID=1576542 RepID=A0A9P8W1B4_9HYPO|nr:hypothetical protein B0T10DRAFT_490376 [Thelonectria olida]